MVISGSPLPEVPVLLPVLLPPLFHRPVISHKNLLSTESGPALGPESKITIIVNMVRSSAEYNKKISLKRLI